jgi:hypothetical protein
MCDHVVLARVAVYKAEGALSVNQTIHLKRQGFNFSLLILNSVIPDKDETTSAWNNLASIKTCS